MLNDIALDISDSVDIDRFRTIVKRYLAAHGLERQKLKHSLLKWLRFDPNSDRLIHDLITLSVDSKFEGRFDAPIDVLNQLGSQIVHYAQEYVINDIRQWNLRFPGRAYEPNDEYWYVLLRSVGQAAAVPSEKLSVVKLCRTASSRGIAEAVIEALGDIGTTEAFAEVRKFETHEDPFIAFLAHEMMSSR